MSKFVINDTAILDTKIFFGLWITGIIYAVLYYAIRGGTDGD